MSRAISIGYTESVSESVRTRGVVTFEFEELRQLRSLEYIVIYSGQNQSPVWVAKVKEFTFAAVADSNLVTAHLEGLINALEIDPLLRMELFRRLSDEVRNGFCLHEIDAEKMHQAVETVRFTSASTLSLLSLAEATRRLAWTYGVAEDKVSIQIKN